MTPATESKLHARVQTLMGGTATVQRVALQLGGLFELLVASDQIGRASIVRAQTGSTPPLPQGGQAQFAFVLYWMKYEPSFFTSFLSEMPALVRDIWGVIDDIVRTDYPPSVTPAEYAWAQAQPEGVIAPDGTILGTGSYEDFDRGWFWSLFNYLFNLVEEHRISPFIPKNPPGPPFIRVLQTHGGQARIALVGDWGTGAFDSGGGYDPATSVMQSIVALKPDYLIHLGDVYYAGTQDALPSGEESQNFLKMWPAMPPERSFTLNSNHEMYGGANGYFNVALGRGAGQPTPFAHQNGYSYFALSFGELAIVGLDAAYFDPSAMYMDGGLGASTTADPQYTFLKGIAATHSQLILLTHQSAMSFDGTRPLPLWTDVCRVIDPAQIKLWYWGHIHAGIAYGQQSALGVKGVRAGCSGHGAIPIGAPWGLQEQGVGIDWCAHQPVDSPAPTNRVRNGFAMLTVTAKGVSEAFYNEGIKTPAWTRRSY